MNRQTNRPEPGEDRHEDQLQGEVVEQPTTSDELPAAKVPDRLQTMELPKVTPVDCAVDQTNHHDDIRRTGTERDGMRPVQVGGETEDRLDHTAHDLQREARFDPAQDNAGPQSDKN